jgi:hypothetical protein
MILSFDHLRSSARSAALRDGLETAIAGTLIYTGAPYNGDSNQ